MTNKAQYKQFCEQHHLPIFYQPWWLDIVSSSWDTVIYKKSTTVFGVFPFELKRKFGLTYLLPPTLTPQLGPWVIYPEGQKINTKLGFEKEVVQGLIRDLPKHHLSIIKLHPSFTNTQPLQWEKYSSSVKYTFLLRAIKNNESSIYEQLSSNTRKNIKKASRNIEVSSSDHVETLIELSNQTFSRQGLKNPYSSKVIKELFHKIKEKNQGDIMLATDENGNNHAALLLVWDKHSAYYLIGGSDSTYRNSEAMSLLMWKAIEKASLMVDNFDFEGTMLESVERFIRGFGGEQTPYYQLVKSNPNWLKSLFGIKLDLS